MAFRRGTRRLVDPVAGPLEIEGDGFAAAGEIVTLVVAPPVQRFLAMTAGEADAAQRTVRDYRESVSALYADPGRPSPDPRDSQRDISGAARRAADTLRALLGDDRFGRLRALSWRILDGDALLDDEVAAALDLSPAQRADLAARAEANARETAAAFKEFSKARLANVDRLHDRIADDDARRSRTLLDLLSPAQRGRFERLQREEEE